MEHLRIINWVWCTPSRNSLNGLLKERHKQHTHVDTQKDTKNEGCLNRRSSTFHLPSRPSLSYEPLPSMATFPSTLLQPTVLSIIMEDTGIIDANIYTLQI